MGDSVGISVSDIDPLFGEGVIDCTAFKVWYADYMAEYAVPYDLTVGHVRRYLEETSDA